MLLITGFLFLFVVFVAMVSRKLNIPLIIIALSIGIFFGSDVTGLIYFDNAKLMRDIADIALLFILFSGGLGTKLFHLKPVILESSLLATLGVLCTAVIAGVLFSLISGWDLSKSLLVCAIISSTDAGAVFSILRSRSINNRVTAVTEVESAANDPMAIITTTFLIALVGQGNHDSFRSIGLFLWQLVGGAGIGILSGFLAAKAFRKITELDEGYSFLLLIGLILVTYSLSDHLGASGMLSVFFGGVVVGNSRIPHKNSLSSFSETLSFIANVGMFILLGLLVFPKAFAQIWPLGLLLFLLISFISRPLAVLVCTAFSKLSIREKLFLGWSGIRGAVPIVLATYPAAAGIDPDHEIFNTVFLAVALSILIQGTTVGKMADLLKLGGKRRAVEKRSMELTATHNTDYELIEVHVDEEKLEGECRIAELRLPEGTTITLVNRNQNLIAPSGQTVILPGDVLSVLVKRNHAKDASDAVLTAFKHLR
ncbi:MAG TPA: potassium/proton antiporter [Fibrobacteraceae bacterium]|nr:potassium/proton antiporter [Fibrobacteraceae bacterium]